MNRLLWLTSNKSAVLTQNLLDEMREIFAQSPTATVKGHSIVALVLDIRAAEPTFAVDIPVVRTACAGLMGFEVM